MKIARTATKTILIGLTALLTASCDGDGIFEATVQNLAGVYRFTGHTTQVHGTAAVVDVMAATPCYQDNRLRINADGTFALLDEGVTCDPPVAHEGTWSLPSPNIMLVGGIPIEIQFDGRTLLQRVYETTDGTTTIRTITMVKL